MCIENWCCVIVVQGLISSRRSHIDIPQPLNFVLTILCTLPYGNYTGSNQKTVLHATGTFDNWCCVTVVQGFIYFCLKLTQKQLTTHCHVRTPNVLF